MKKRKRYLSFLLTAVITATSIGFPQSIKSDSPAKLVSDEDLSNEQVDAPEAWGVTPNDEQLHYMKSGLAAFCHFGPNCFMGSEWGDKWPEAAYTDPSLVFTLKSGFDADNIVKMVKDAGFSRLMLTAKHHDGLCLWNSKTTTTYNVTEAGYDGDILAEISAACTKYNLDMGCYLSPWDVHEDKVGCFGDAYDIPNSKGYTDYNDLYIDSIKEINNTKDEDGNYLYGNNNPERRSDRFVEWWMDGAQGEAKPQTFSWKDIFGAIREQNPNCQIFGTHAAGNGRNGAEDKALASTGGIHWIGNETGYASETTWAKVTKGESYENKTLFPRPSGAIEGSPTGDQWSVPEVDSKIIGGWFWSSESNEKNSLKSENDLADLYFNSVGHGAVLLLNLSPNNEGKVSDIQANRFRQFGENIKESFAEDFTKASGVTASATSVWKNAKAYSPLKVLDKIPDGEEYDNTYWAPDGWEEGDTASLEINLGQPKTFDVVSIEEYIQKGQAISSFSVEYKDLMGQWHEFGSGTTISSKRLIRTEPVEGIAIRININSSYSLPMINNVGVFKLSKGFELASADAIMPPSSLQTIPIQDFTLDSSWTYQDAEMSGSADKDQAGSAWSSAEKNGVASFTFTGSQAWIYGKKDPGHGTVLVKIDGKVVDIFDTSSNQAKVNVCLYETPELECGEHTIELICNTKALGLSGAKYADDSGVFEVGKKEYSLLYGGTIQAEIIRKGGSSGRKTVSYMTQSAGAEQGVNYEHISGEVTFEDGETLKTVTLTAKDKTGEPTHDSRIVDGKNFLFTLLSSEGGASVKTNSYANVILYTYDGDGFLETCKQLNTDSYQKEGVLQFETALKELQACKESGTATADALKAAIQNLQAAKNALIPENGKYSTKNPFSLPGKVGNKKLIEAEEFLLDSSNVTGNDNKVCLTVTEDGKFVDNFKNGNQIKLPYYAKRGLYLVKVFYRSGRSQEQPNVLSWTGTDIESGQLKVYQNAQSAGNLNAEFTIKVTKTGDGELIFTTDENDAPMIDRFEIVLQEDFEETENNLKHEQALNNLKQEIAAQKTKRETGNGAYTKETWDAFVSAYDAAVSAGSDTSTDVLNTLLNRLKETAGKLKESNSDLKEFSDGTFMYQVMNITDKTVVVSKLQNAKLKKLQIKDNVNYNNTVYKIVGIKADAFKNNKTITSVTIGNNVHTIYAGAFTNCKKLKNITVGTALEEIGAKAFSGCKQLKTIKIKSKSLKRVGKKALKGIYKNAVIRVPAKNLKTYQKLMKKKGQSKTVQIKK